MEMGHFTRVFLKMATNMVLGATSAPMESSSKEYGNMAY